MPVTYTYVDSQNLIKEIGESDLNYAGLWSSGSTYFFSDVVLWNDTRYMALASGSNNEPPVREVRDEQWSVLVMSIQGTGGGTITVTDAYYLAQDALNVATSASDVANQAYGLATYAISIAGTAGGGSGDVSNVYSLARLALDTAWVGTQAAHSADMWGRTAYHLAVAGTNAANSADMWGRTAYSLAVTGTNAALAAQSQANAAYNLAYAAYDLAATGTMIGSNALVIASYGSVVAEQAYGLATYAISLTGTSVPVDISGVYSLARTALDTAWMGTNIAIPAYNIAVAGTTAANSADMWGRTAYNLAVAGTTAANSADMWGRDAFSLAVTGTNKADAAQNSANEALAELATISTLVLAGESGTHKLYVAQVPNWKSDLPMTVQNGVVTFVGESRFNYADFKSEAVGLTGTTTGNLSTGKSWAGTGIVTSWMRDYYLADPSQDPLIWYGRWDFTTASTGTIGVDFTSWGYGTTWDSTVQVGISNAIVGTESWRDYDLGYIDGTQVVGGYGWTGTTAFYQP